MAGGGRRCRAPGCAIRRLRKATTRALLQLTRCAAPRQQAAELSALDKHTGTADLLLIALVRSVANGACAAHKQRPCATLYSSKD